MSNLFDLPDTNWSFDGDVTATGNTWVVPIEGSFSENANGRLYYYYSEPAIAGDTLEATINYTITATGGDVWFIVMPDGSGGEFSKKLAASGQETPITGSFTFSVEIPVGTTEVELGTYNQLYAYAGGAAPDDYGPMGNFVTPKPPEPFIPCFWTDMYACSEDCGEALTKLAHDVYVPPVLQLPYRPYSKVCPQQPPAHTKRWITKTVCGTVTVTLSSIPESAPGRNDGKSFINRTVSLPGVPDVTTVTEVTGTTSPTALGTFPYCTTMTVYE